MKVIVSGATGFIGSEVLTQCLENPRISTVYALSRRELPSSLTSNPKLKVVILKDFLHYSDEVLEQFTGAEACIWTVGLTKFGPGSDPRLVDIAYSQAAAAAFHSHLQPKLAAGRKFRFVHTSGIFAQQDQAKALWMLEEPRKSKGQSEVEMLRFAREHGVEFEAYVVRAGVVVAKTNALASVCEWGLPGWVIGTRTLALAMIDVLEEAGPSRLVYYDELVRRGQRAASRI